MNCFYKLPFSVVLLVRLAFNRIKMLKIQDSDLKEADTAKGKRLVENKNQDPNLHPDYLFPGQ